MYTLNMLEVINPAVEGKGYCKRYINGRRVSDTRWWLAFAHSTSRDSLVTNGKNGKWYHRQALRCRINFGE